MRPLSYSSGSIRLFVKWGLFLVIAYLLAWRIIIVGIAEYYAGQYDPQSANSALIWYPSHPKALEQQGRLLAGTDPLKAEQLLRKAAWENPIDGNIYAGLALLSEEQGEMRKAAELMHIANDLAPMRRFVQMKIAAFWLRQDQPGRAIRHWNAALESSSRIGRLIYPLLLGLVEYPQAQAAFADLLLYEPPAWWIGFFHYAAASADNLEVLRTLYQLGHEEGRQPSEDERNLYIARLQSEGQWPEAYAVWVDSLDNQQLDALDNIFDGNFELTLDDQDFGWRTPRVRGVVIETAPTPGASGSKALRVIFQGKRVPFRHLYQNLLLRPGRYQLTGLFRLDALQTARGVQWTLRCQTGSQQVLGGSERYLGTAQWRPFTSEFVVPDEDCQVQQLRLELAGRFAQEFEAEGVVWFDNLAIKWVD